MQTQVFQYPRMQSQGIKQAQQGSIQKINPASLNELSNNNNLATHQQSTNQQPQISYQSQDDAVQLKSENQALKQKLEFFQNMIENSKQWDPIKNILDIKGYIQKNQQIYSDLIDELYKEKSSHSKENIPPVPEQKDSMMQNANMNFYLNKIKELEEKNEMLNKDANVTKDANKKLKEDVQKKDFFREYDYMCKEVEGLRKQNQNLSEQIKKLQSSK